MPELLAVVLIGAAAVFYITTGSRVAPSVTFAKPTTVIPAGSVIFAALALVTVIAIGSGIDASPVWVLIAAIVIPLAILAGGGTTAGNRLVYDRGGYRLAPGRVIGALVVAIVCIVALLRQGAT